MKKIIFMMSLCFLLVLSNRGFSMDNAENNRNYEIKEVRDKDGRKLKDGVKMPAMTKEQKEEIRRIKEEYRTKMEALKRQEMAEIRAVLTKEQE